MRSLREIARMSVSHFAESAPMMGLRAGGYFRAASELIEDTYVLAVGPQAQSLADAASRRAPLRFCAPVFGDMRPDVQRLGPGLYVVAGNDIRGPMEVIQAIELLGKTLASPSLAPRP